MRYFPLLLIVLASCGASKTVYREKVVTDSTALSALREDNRMIREELERRQSQTIDTQGVQIIFQTDTLHLPGTVTIDRSGVIAATGRLQSVQVSNRNLTATIDELRRTVDSLSSMDSITSVRVVKEVRTVEKVVKRPFIPWWIWLVVAGLVVWKAWPYIRKVVRI